MLTRVLNRFTRQGSECIGSADTRYADSSAVRTEESEYNAIGTGSLFVGVFFVGCESHLAAVRWCEVGGQLPDHRCRTCSGRSRGRTTASGGADGAAVVSGI